jgi:hypothetical protein
MLQDIAGFWDSLKRAVVPESYGESVVNSIYSDPANTLKPDPYYDVDDLSSPNIYVQAKGAVKDTVSAFNAFGTKAVIVIAVFLLHAIAVYEGVGGLARR